jgi:hypothetical protein
VIAEVKRKPHQDDRVRDERERRHQENALDEALKDTFPASDPVSVEATDTARRRPRQGKDLKDDEVALRDAIERVRLFVAARIPGFVRLLLRAFIPSMKTALCFRLKRDIPTQRLSARGRGVRVRGLDLAAVARSHHLVSGPVEPERCPRHYQRRRCPTSPPCAPHTVTDSLAGRE